MWPGDSAPHIGIFVRNLSCALEAEGLEVECVALIKGKGRGLLGKSRVHLGLGAGLLRSMPRPADILYVHAPSWFASLSALNARWGHKRMVVHMHGGEVYPHSRIEAASQTAVRQLCREADLVVSPSKYYAGQAQAAFNLDPGRVFVSPSGGVDTRWFSPGDQSEARRVLGLPLAPLFLGLFGRIEDDKGWDVFIDVLAALRAQGRDARGLVVGGGGALERMKASAHRLNVPLEVRGLMPQARLRDAYRALDLFVFPTRRGAEALGLVPIEAMACGVPVIASNRYAVPEYVQPGVTGHLAPPRDVHAFTHAALSLLDQLPTHKAQMSKSACEAAARFDARVSAKALVQRLTDLMETAPC